MLSLADDSYFICKWVTSWDIDADNLLTYSVYLLDADNLFAFLSAETFANSLNPDQAWQNFKPDLNPNCLIDTLMIFLKVFLKKK